MISSLSLSFSLGATGLRVALLVCESEAVLMVTMMHRREVFGWLCESMHLGAVSCRGFRNESQFVAGRTLKKTKKKKLVPADEIVLES